MVVAIAKRTSAKKVRTTNYVRPCVYLIASSEDAPPMSNDFAIDMPRIDRPEEQNSARKSQEGEPRLELDPCKELNTILESKAQPGAGTSSSGGVEAAKPQVARPLIQKVPRILRENEKNKNNYDPRLVSIGPYHYGDPKLELGQTLKTRLVQQFSSYVKESSKGSKSLNAYLHSEYFSEVACEARDCYAKESTTLNEEAFKCLMFLDGCFVVYFIHCIVNNKCKDVGMKNDHKAIIIMDLFLLENQLPYKVLQALVHFLPTKACACKADVNDDIETFIKMQIGPKGMSPARELTVYDQQLPDICTMVVDCVCGKHYNGTTDKSDGLKKDPLHLLDFLRTEFLVVESISVDDELPQQIDEESIVESQTFRSVEELKVAGINCLTSGSSSVKTIKFEAYKFLPYGRLFLPAIVIDDSFKTKWLNMAAYEACPDFFNDGDITSFICFMDSLINCSADVKELRERGVLQNYLGSDQLVAEIFNEVATNLTPNPDEYQQIKRNIQKHFKKTRAVWFAEFVHTHFSSPWTLLASLAVVLALILIGSHTYFAAFPHVKKITTLLPLPRPPSPMPRPHPQPLPLPPLPRPWLKQPPPPCPK